MIEKETFLIYKIITKGHLSHENLTLYHLILNEIKNRIKAQTKDKKHSYEHQKYVYQISISKNNLLKNIYLNDLLK